MSALEISGPVPPPPRKPLVQRLIDYVLIGGLVLLLLIGFERVGMPQIVRLFTNSAHMQAYFVQFLNPDWTHLRSYCLLYTSPSPRDRTRSRMPSSA